ncbi:hypothetical protein ACFL27_09410 [candidate division CSSED10-310 bacterium]|uniref:Uncharacterized protein n=1 Tax=candidate division CSSED10-310 bacterium TaxID=2855610 RepID=A0ABV6YW52_UNCC1
MPQRIKRNLGIVVGSGSGSPWDVFQWLSVVRCTRPGEIVDDLAILRNAWSSPDSPLGTGARGFSGFPFRDRLGIARLPHSGTRTGICRSGPNTSVNRSQGKHIMGVFAGPVTSGIRSAVGLASTVFWSVVDREHGSSAAIS